jgi:oxygen-independent coproporphyrinogen-3 oxidase
MYEIAQDFLDSKGYVHYEISNWAKNGKEALHNSNYWRNLEYIGLGAGASGYWKRIRYKNCEDILRYIKDIADNKKPLIEKEEIDDKTYNNEKIILGLRLLKEGVDKNDFAGKENILNELLQKKYLAQEQGRIKIAKDYTFVSNSIILEFV